MDEARIEITAGAGGVESEAWAEMVRRMYIRWATRHSLTVKPGREVTRTEVGIKSATFTIVGASVRRLLAEDGLHRLVRISPFDAGERRHTSFAAVDVEMTIEDHVVERPYWRHNSPFGRAQIRSYVLHPYKMVKDLRTGVAREDVEAVLDGDIDEFLDGAEAAGIPHKPDPNAPTAAV